MSLHDEIMRLEMQEDRYALPYANGYSDARDDAAELACKIDAEIERLARENAVLCGGFYRGQASRNSEISAIQADAHDTIVDMRSEIKRLSSENARLTDENKIFRRLLALAHDRPGHLIYGDDGELQCSVCWVDFVRDSAQDIQRKLQESGMRELQRAIAAGTWPPKSGDSI